MTLQQFIDKYNGKYLEAYDPTNLNQCYDLVTQWARDIGLKPPMTMYAYQIYDNPPTGWTKVENTPDAIPKAGDIIVWSKNFNGTAGHTAVAVSGNLNNFVAFSQNDPLGSPCVLKTYSYNYVRGWLTPLTVTDTNMDSKKAIQFDRVLNYLKEKGYVADNDSNHYLDGEFLDLIKKLYDDYKSNSKRAGKWDTLCNKVYGPVDSNSKTPDGVYETIKLSVRPDIARIQELEKFLAECELKCQQQKPKLIAKIIELLNTL